MSSESDDGTLFERLRRALESGRLAHAYVFAGLPSRTHAMAIRLLQLLHCDSGSGRPCGRCPACRNVAAHRHADSLWIEPRNKSRNIDIDTVRSIRGHMARSSMAGRWKSAVFAGADRMQEPAANALLKMLEEPTPDTIFLLLSDNPQALLDTVRSRCQVLRLHGGGGAPDAFSGPVLEILEAGGPGVIGGLLRARRLGALLKPERERIEKEEKAAVNWDLYEGKARERMEEIVDARVAARYKGTLSDALLALERWYHDILLCAAGAGESFFIHGDRAHSVRALAAGLTCGRACHNIRVIEDMKGQVDLNVSESMLFDRAFAVLTARNKES